MKPSNTLPSAEFLNERFRYEPETGKLYWKERPREHFKSNGNYARFMLVAGKEVGCVKSQETTKKTMNITVNFRFPDGVRRSCTTHRIVLAMNGIEVPAGMVVDHIDGDPTNNRLGNLRICTHSQNIANSEHYRRGRELPRGVYKNPNTGRYVSYASINGKKVACGTFNTPEEAQKAYLKKCEELHGQFSRAVKEAGAGQQITDQPR